VGEGVTVVVAVVFVAPLLLSAQDASEISEAIKRNNKKNSEKFFRRRIVSSSIRSLNKKAVSECNPTLTASPMARRAEGNQKERW
jgi:hypothetical protein